MKLHTTDLIPIPRIFRSANGSGHKRLLQAAAGVALLALAALNATAGNVTLTASDGYGAHSFDAAGSWDSHAAPAAGNNYFTGPFILRTPSSGANSITFLGDSLTVSPGGALYAKLAPLTVTINTLTNMGRVDNAQGGVFTLLGNMFVPTDNGGGAMDTGSGNSSATDNRSISNAMTIRGSGVLTNYTSDANWSKYPQAQGTVVYSGNNSAFTGPQVLLNNTVVQVGSQANLGGNPASFNPAQLLLDNGVLQPTASFSLNNPNSGITIGAGGGTFNIPAGLRLTNANPLAGAGTLTLNNSGTFLQQASGMNFTGNVAVNAGTLALGAGGDLSGSRTISVANGATLDASATGLTLASGQTLAGVGAVVGTTTAGSGSQINPAGVAAAGTLSLAALTLSGGATLALDFMPATNDVIAISGNLTPSGVTTIQLPTVPSANGTYTLLTVGGTLGGSAANFRVAALSTRTKSFAITYDTASTPKRVLLQVSGSGSTGNLVWQGDGAANLWDITTSRNWLNGANADVYYDADTVNFTDAGAANQPVLDVTVNPGAVNFNATSDYTLTGLGSIAGPTRLTKSGTGTATLSLSNLYSGGTFVTDGVLKLGATNALGSPAGATALASVSGTGTLDLNGMAVDSASYGASTNAIQINGNGSSATKGAIDSSTGYMNVGYGDIGINNLVLLGDSTVSASGSSWQIGNTGLGITGNGHTLTKIGNNLLILKKPAVNPLANLVVAGGGIAFFDRPDAVGATTPIILTNGGLIETWNQAAWNGLTFANPILVSDPVNGGQIANFRTPYYNHPDYDTFNGNITLNGPLTFTNTAYYNGAPLNVDTFGKITVNGSLSGTGAVVVVGGTSHYAANWIQGGNLVVFNGNNSYSGPTLVSNLVQLQISTANQSGGAYDVVDNGTLDVAQAPGKPTMPMSSLTLEAVFMGPGNISFSRLSSLSSTPVLYVTNLVINGGCLIPPVAGYSVGQFPLIKYAGSIGGNGFSSLTLGQLPTGVTAQLVNNEVNHSIDLAVTTSGILWKGTASSIWDLGGAFNWFNPVTSSTDTYVEGETVVFDDSASRFDVFIPSPLAPQGVTVNAARDYSISGNSIGNGAALIKTGSGTLTIASTNNTFTGGTFINGGTLKLADTNYAYPYGAGALNNNLGTVTVANGGTLDVNAVQVPNYQSYGPEGYNVFLSGAGVNGNGALVNNSTNNNDSADPGYVTLVSDATVGGIGDLNIRHGASPQLTSQSGAYTLTKVGPGSFRLRYLTTVSTNFGPINILQGIVSYESSSPLGLGDPTKPIYVGSGGGFAWGTVAAACVRPLICSNNSAIYGYNTATNVFNSPVTLVSGNVNLNANYYNGLIFSNVLSGAGGITLQYNSYATFAAANTYSGNTTVANCNAGAGSVLRLVGNGSISSSPSITLLGITAGQALPGALDVSGRTDGTLTLVSGQTLRGDNGSYIRGNVVAGSGATIAPGGLASIQYMSVSNNLTLQAGSTVAMEVSLDSGATNDTINVTGTATYNGTLQLANIGATPLTAGNSFKLFKSGGFSGNFATMAGSPGTGLNWTFNPTNGIATVVASTASNPTNITFAVSGNQVTLSWPTDHLGWTLQAQTNSVGVGRSTNWVDVPDSATVTQKVMPVNSANGAVFYRLRH